MPACGPRRGYASRPIRPIFIDKAFRTLARGQASRGGRCKTSSGAATLGRLTRGGEIKARKTSRGSSDVSHDDHRQAGASACSVLVSSLVQRGQAQPWSTEASSKGFHIGATRPKTSRMARWRSPWSPRWRHHQRLLQAKTTFVRITCTSCLHSNLAVVGSLPAYIWEEDQGYYK